MNNDQLKELIYKIGNNQDSASFSKIFDFFAPRVVGYLRSSGILKEIAEEITQEVLTNIWLKSDQFDQKKGNVSTWVFTIARNKKIDRLRKNENPSYNTIDFISAFYPNEEDQNSEKEEIISKMLILLDESERKLLKMNFFEGKTHKIIAKDLEIPLGTVKSRIRTILNKIKNL